MIQTAKYPIGLQSFAKVREGGYKYVDKTKFIWQLDQTGKYYFLSRPRRFGKSLFISTLEAYFTGRRDLFEGLEISEYEKEWIEYPVLHLDLNTGRFDSGGSLDEALRIFINTYAHRYAVKVDHKVETAYQFGQLIREIATVTGQNVVILVDEYDKPLLNAIGDERRYADYQQTLKAFYGNLKSCDQYIRFAMLTGVARFGKVSIFSDLNNLNDISLNSAYGDICGIAEDELEANFGNSIAALAAFRGESVEETSRLLKANYDGYHFADPHYAKGVYNPFSILSCFYENRFSDYWFETGTASILLKPAIARGLDITELGNIEVSEVELRGVNTPADNPISLLYQTGYLTIKAYDDLTRTYTLGFPNNEVRRGFDSVTFQIMGQADANEFSVRRFLQDLRKGDPQGFMQRLQALFANMPHEQARYTEATYNNVLYVLFSLLGFMTGSETHSSHGVSDLYVKTDKNIFLFEFKTDGTAQDALDQIENRHYDWPFRADGRAVVKIGVKFSKTDRNITDWKIA